MKKSFIVLNLSLLLAACGQKAIEETSPQGLSTNESIAYSAQTAMNAAKDFSDDAGAYSSSESVQSKAICTGLAFRQSCNNGVKYIDYDSCRVPFTNATANGFIQLTHSDNSCEVTQANQSVNREYDITFTGLYGQVNISSADKQDYLGETFGGGGVLTRLGLQEWQIDVLGQHRSYKGVLGRELINFSVKTTDPIIVNGDIMSQSRTLVSGQVQVSHNLAKAQAIYTFNNLKYSNSCCYPISGQLSVDISGSIERSGTIEITGCGTAKLYNDNNNASVDLTFNSCE